MKKLLLILTLCMMTTGLYAHCGSCGVGDKPKTKAECSACKTKKVCKECKTNKVCKECKLKKAKKSSLVLPANKQRQLDKVSADYHKKLHKLRRSYKRKIAKVLKNENERKVFFEDTK